MVEVPVAQESRLTPGRLRRPTSQFVDKSAAGPDLPEATEPACCTLEDDVDAPLEGITIREASRDLGVRYCGRLFAQLGASVFRMTGGGDSRIGHGGASGLAAWARDRDSAAAAHDLQRLGVPAAPVQRTDTLTGDPHLISSGFWAQMERR